MVEGGRHQALRQGGLHGCGHGAPGRDKGEHLAPLLDQRVHHGDHDLAAQGLAQGAHRGDGAVPRRGQDDEVRFGGPGVVCPAKGQVAVGPAGHHLTRHRGCPLRVA